MGLLKKSSKASGAATPENGTPTKGAVTPALAAVNTREAKMAADPFANVFKKGKHYEIEDIHAVVSWFGVVMIYASYVTWILFGYAAEYIIKVMVFLRLAVNPLQAPKGYAPLVRELEYFWLHRIYQRARDCFERPICSVPGASFTVMDRISRDKNASFEFTGTQTNCLNLGSYNYLGFAENSGKVIDTVTENIKKNGAACASPRMEAGNFDAVVELERRIANFVNKEDAVVFGMGFATNSTTLPIICGGKGTLIISDTLNHNSLVTGSRGADHAIVRTFKHNDVEDLERVIRNSIVEGQPRTHRPWKKIFIIVEGIYSMEGEICKLPQIVALKKKYKAYLYVDEAHSIGALGEHGRGVCDYWGIPSSEVDILMGTFTKAFGSVGGYVAGSKDLIAYLRNRAYGSVYATSMSPPCAQQALSALRIIMGEDGTDEGQRRLARLHDNSNFFRNSLRMLGFHVFGHKDSPVVPMMTFGACDVVCMSRTLLQKGIAIVAVGFPVTPLVLTRIRFCISSAHTREQLEFAVRTIHYYGGMFGFQYAKPLLDKETIRALKTAHKNELSKELYLE